MSSSTGRKQGRGGGERRGPLPGLARVPTSPGLCSGSRPPVRSSVHPTAIYWASAVITGHKAVTETDKHPCALRPVDPRGEDDEQSHKLSLQSPRWGHAPRSQCEMARRGEALLGRALKVARREPSEDTCSLSHVVLGCAAGQPACPLQPRGTASLLQKTGWGACEVCWGPFTLLCGSIRALEKQNQ